MNKALKFAGKLSTEKKNWIKPEVEVIGKDIIQIGSVIGGPEGAKTVSNISVYSS